MSARTKGRIAGLVYLGLVISGIFSLAYAPGQLIAPDDPATTLANMREQFSLFLAMIASGVIMAFFFLVLPFTLARFLSVYGKNAARLMILLVVMSIPVTLLALWQYGELAQAIADKVATVEDVDAARAGYRRWITVSTFFWGAWLAPYGWLVLKSGSIPRWFGAMLLIGSVGYLTELFGPMFIPHFDELPFVDYVTKPASIGEIGSCLWLVVFGARASNSGN
ncbi:DUF4386 domain-containing protein [Hyphococcus flavus]|uniref:DUF4386 domain-containing protein n=1 Tax=Hyphococcus flavus TaxID=1866326 RepID=A0AAF0CED6_9PROT|nr:DUF4386 domain-containing protein [Hyphococcus flavus]WDI31121.1 DUF4386 domain-containing protein [Hyphococcus flavus]